jgi:hypothetical protein
VLSVIPTGCSTSSASNDGKGLPVTSISNCCITVKPPPEYREMVPGTTSTLIAAVLAGFWPSRIWTGAGTGASAEYPGNPLTVRPAVWLRSRRSVTFSVFVNSFSGTFQDVRRSFTSWSSDSLPCSTSRSAARAATGLLIDAAWKRVRGVTDVLPPVSVTP